MCRNGTLEIVCFFLFTFSLPSFQGKERAVGNGLPKKGEITIKEKEMNIEITYIMFIVKYNYGYCIKKFKIIRI